MLHLIEQTDDEALTEYLEEALENLDFIEELNKFDLLLLDEDADLEDVETLDEDE